MALLRCFVCKGRKSVYRIGKVYSLVDISGSKPIECPECGGIGKILDDAEKEKIRLESDKATEKNDTPAVNEKGTKKDAKESSPKERAGKEGSKKNGKVDKVHA